MSSTCSVLLRLVCCVFGFFELLLMTFMMSHFLIYISYIYISTQCPRYRHSHWCSFTCSPSHFWQLWADFVPICGTDARWMTVAGFEAMDVRIIRGMGRSAGMTSSREEASAWCSPAWSVLSLCVCHIPLLMSHISMKFFEIPSHIVSYLLIRLDKTQLVVCW